MYEGWRDRDPGPGRGIDERYRALPLLTKDDIRAHFPYGLVPRGLDLDAARARGEVSFVRTSGTADEALENIWNQALVGRIRARLVGLNPVSARVATGTHQEAILASALSVGPRSESRPLERSDADAGKVPLPERVRQHRTVAGRAMRSGSSPRLQTISPPCWRPIPRSLPAWRAGRRGTGSTPGSRRSSPLPTSFPPRCT